MTDETTPPWWKSPPAIAACIVILGSAYTVVTSWNGMMSRQAQLALAIEDERNDRIDWQVRHMDDAERRRGANTAADVKLVAAIEGIQTEQRALARLVEGAGYRLNSLEQAAPRDQAMIGELNKAVNTLTNAVGLLTQRIDGLSGQ